MSADFRVGRIEQLTAAAAPGPIPETVFATVSWTPSLEQMCKGYDRYEYVRTLSPQQFHDLWTRALGVIPFDDLVDAEIAKRAANKAADAH